MIVLSFILCFCFNDTATTEIYTYCPTLSLHDALPIFVGFWALPLLPGPGSDACPARRHRDRQRTPVTFTRMLERLPKSRVSGMCMNRSIVTIEPALAGWVVSFEGQALQVLPSKLEAIGFASRRAAEEHRLSGVPCGVSVRLRTGETVLVALHGWEGQTVRGSLR